MNYKSILIYDINYIMQEIDNIDDEELEEIYRKSMRFSIELHRELSKRSEYED